MKTVAFYTLGCKLNFSETSTIGRLFVEQGYRKVEFEDTPNIFVINTCSVTENADKKCRQIINRAKNISPDSYVVVIGCFAQLKPLAIAQIPQVDAVLGASEKFNLLEHLKNFEKQQHTLVRATNIANATTFHHAYSIAERTRTFLKIQDGCNYGCAFCTIPLARGKSRSNTVEKIIATTKKIAQTEVKEVVLTGVNIGDFGIHNGKRNNRFIHLIQALDKVQGISRFRISSIEPNLLNHEIIDFVAKSQRFVPHFHVPLQSGSNKILKLMNRRYRKELYLERVLKIKQEMPHACIGVDIIVGFPGESHEDFLDTYHFLNALDISYIHVFSYSARANTAAATMPKVVPIKEKQTRAKQLRILSEKKKRAFYTAHLGTTQHVLIENSEQPGVLYGFTENYIKVSLPNHQNLINQIKLVSLEQINDQLLVNASLLAEGKVKPQQKIA